MHVRVADAHHDRGTTKRLAALATRSEGRRVTALTAIDPVDQARLGQFFTPDQAAELIARMPRLPASGRLRILDPGAGTGSLTAALVHRILAEAPGVAIDVVAVEVDPVVAVHLAATLDDCVSTAAACGTHLATALLVRDFVDAAGGLDADPLLAQPFDIVIMNPPYAKLAAGSWQRDALQRQGIDCPNLYAAFLALGVAALKPGGQLVAITPRSFANGPYFHRFRGFLLDSVAVDRLHTFESRSTVFSDTGVLQENVVISATRAGSPGKVTLTVSRGHTDQPTERVVDYSEVVRPGDRHRFLRIAVDDRDTAAAQMMAAMPATLDRLGLEVSTGRVVDFRSRPNLREAADGTCVPLVYPGNLRGGRVEWPRAIRKPQGFAVLGEADHKLLLPAGCYVVVKRFSAKEERRRIVAAVWDPAHNGTSLVAFENHLNVFHRNGHGLDPEVAVGLSLWLNSGPVDAFFRTFSGHTQVNASDLRALRYPAVDDLRFLSAGRATELPDQAEIDRIIASVTELPDDLR